MSTKPAYLRALEALRRREGLFRVFVFTLVTSLFWIGFSIFQAQQNTKVTVDIRKHTEPLNPNINQEVLDELATRRKYTPEELQIFPLYERVVDDDGISTLQIAGTQPVVTEETEEEETAPEEPVIAETEEATPSAEETASPSATPEVTEQPAP
jgi:hypothetical protein